MTTAEAQTILDIPAGTSPERMKETYRALVRHWHPDQYREEQAKTDAQEKMREIIEAYRMLSNAPEPEPEPEPQAQKKQYDSDDHEVTAAIVSFVLAAIFFGVGMWVFTTYIMPRGISQKATAMSFVAMFGLWGILYGLLCPVFEQSARNRAENPKNEH